MRIITVSREFGSGGRELGKRLADTLGIAYYDREIITAISEKNSLDEGYVEQTLENGLLKNYPYTFGRTLSRMSVTVGSAPSLLAQQHKVIKELAARGDCVIIGRGADAVLAEENPLKLFIYADMAAKIERCRKRADGDETMSDRELERKMKQIDKARAANHGLVASYAWGDKKGYQLCINTTDTEIKAIIPCVAAYAKTWFERSGSHGTVI